MRRGAYVLPKYLNGMPTDQPPRRCARMPLPVQRFMLGRCWA